MNPVSETSIYTDIFIKKMKTLKFILIGLCGIISPLSAQVAVFDSTQYLYPLPKATVIDRFSASNFNDWNYLVIYAINDLQKWSKKKEYSKGIIVVRVKADEEKISLRLYKMFTTWSFYNTGFPYPDYYSYLDTVPIFWYFGAYKFVQPKDDYKKFIKHKVDKYLFDNLTPFDWFYDDTKNEFVHSNGNATLGDEPFMLPIEHEEWTAGSPVYEYFPVLSNLKASHGINSINRREIYNSFRN
jgi:hypothetical protein